MKTTFTDRQIGGCIGCIITAGLFMLSILAVVVLKDGGAFFIPCMVLFFLATLIEIFLGGMYIKYNNSSKMMWSAFIVAFGMLTVMMLLVLSQGGFTDGYDLVVICLMPFLPVLACSMFLHSSLVLLLRRADWGLYLSQVFCVATAVHSFYWSVKVAAAC